MPDFRKTLILFIHQTGVPLKLLCEIMDWSKGDFLSWYSSGAPTINFLDIERIANYFGLTVNDLVKKNYEPKTIRKLFLKQNFELPQKYSAYAYSHVRTSAHIIDFLRVYYGAGFTDRILIEMGVPPSYFENLDNKISLVFIKELFSKLQQMGIKHSQVYNFGSMAPYFLRETQIGSIFKQAKNYQDFYEILGNIIHRFDSNFDYDFRVYKNKVTLDVKPSEKLKEAMQKIDELKDIKFKDILVYRRHMFESYPIMGNLAGAQAEIKQSIIQGDGCDSYEINLDDQRNYILYLNRNKNILNVPLSNYIKMKNHSTLNGKNDQYQKLPLFLNLG